MTWVIFDVETGDVISFVDSEHYPALEIEAEEDRGIPASADYIEETEQ